MFLHTNKASCFYYNFMYVILPGMFYYRWLIFRFATYIACAGSSITAAAPPSISPLCPPSCEDLITPVTQAHCFTLSFSPCYLSAVLSLPLTRFSRPHSKIRISSLFSLWGTFAPSHHTISFHLQLQTQEFGVQFHICTPVESFLSLLFFSVMCINFMFQVVKLVECHVSGKSSYKYCKEQIIAKLRKSGV